MAKLLLHDGTAYMGDAFGAVTDADGEVVFTTNMVGYPESLTDPSFRGQILVFTFPLVGNYGIPSEDRDVRGFSQFLESEAVHVRGVVVAQESRFRSHQAAVSSLHNWLEHHKIPGITGVDTRAITKRLREHGVMLGRIAQDDNASYTDVADPNLLNLVAEVSCAEPVTYDPPGNLPDAPTILVYDCGMKRNILRSLLSRGVRVVRVPWDYDIDKHVGPIDGVFVSNGPGDPKQCVPTIKSIKRAIERDIPTFGICLGNQLMGLAIGSDTFKLKYGHRGANQPCLLHECPDGLCIPSKRCLITSQNHGFAVSEDLPKGWSVWFRNANDGTVEGIRHESDRFRAVQFHPEASPGPEDAAYLFDEFVAMLKAAKV